MIEGLNPAFILLIGGLLIPLTHGRGRSVFMFALPLLGILQLVSMPYGSGGEISIFVKTKLPAFFQLPPQQ